MHPKFGFTFGRNSFLSPTPLVPNCSLSWKAVLLLSKDLSCSPDSFLLRGKIPTSRLFFKTWLHGSLSHFVVSPEAPHNCFLCMFAALMLRKIVGLCSWSSLWTQDGQPKDICFPCWIGLHATLSFVVSFHETLQTHVVHPTHSTESFWLR